MAKCPQNLATLCALLNLLSYYWRILTSVDDGGATPRVWLRLSLCHLGTKKVSLLTIAQSAVRCIHPKDTINVPFLCAFTPVFHTDLSLAACRVWCHPCQTRKLHIVAVWGVVGLLTLLKKTLIYQDNKWSFVLWRLWQKRWLTSTDEKKEDETLKVRKHEQTGLF